MTKCNELVFMGQSGSAKCGTFWGETEILCDKCKTKIKVRAAYIDGCVDSGASLKEAEARADKNGH